MNTWDTFYGPNAGYALELYEGYLQDPASVDSATRAYFDQLTRHGEGAGAVATLARPSLPPARREGNGAASPAQYEAGTLTTSAPPGVVTTDTVRLVVGAARLARSIREYGHLAARIDPLGAPRPGDPMLEPSTHGLTNAALASLPASVVWPDAGPDAGTCLDAMRRLREIYCGPLGYDFDHVEDYGERAWLHETVEAGIFRKPLSIEEKRDLLYRLTEVEGFERFLHTTYQGQKRFSLEGNDCLIPVLDCLIGDAAEHGTREVLIGMAHRGRLNVLAHIVCKPYSAIFAEFHHAVSHAVLPSEDSMGIKRGWTGDVKYHMGGRTTVTEGEAAQIQVTLADNPSHLEFVDPVVEGFARAAQDDRSQLGAPRQSVARALPITIHGDAAFPGEGVVAETLNLSRLPGYQTGGTVRIIVNNQIGFTTLPEEGRSTLYASDLAKGFEIPIIHVNADDPEACLTAIRIAFAYRHRFHKDALVDLIGYRRWGHNEGDEPSFTQPRLYAQIAQHPTVRALYAEQLVREGVVTQEDVAAMQREVQDRLHSVQQDEPALEPEQVRRIEPVTPGDVETSVPGSALRELNAALLQLPEGFTLNPRLNRIMARHREALDRPGGIDWALGEALAFASILADGTPIRLTGQDTGRGTFSQRHLILYDPQSDTELVPLQQLPQARASFAVYNSPLTEAATLGFEYGYSVHAPDALVLWEAQFGDFANAGQVVIDQFIASARAKWWQQPALVLLLPHGFEGQGPEHSSARLERYLQLAAEDNLRIVNCTTAAQYFHVLRLQAATLGRDRRPLIIMTPKSLLRHPRAASSLQDLIAGHFQPVLDDPRAAQQRDAVRRLTLSSGRVSIDLLGGAEKGEDPARMAVVRLEQLYPFPRQSVENLLRAYPNLDEVSWVQEEPRNMGAWPFVEPLLRDLLPGNLPLHYVGRPVRSSPAEGSPELHAAEQARIVQEALAAQLVQA